MAVCRRLISTPNPFLAEQSPPNTMPPSHTSPSSEPTYNVPLQRTYTWATDSDATADDLPGAGRVVGNLITRGKQPIESLFTRLWLMLGGGPVNPVRAVMRSLQCSACGKPYCAWLPPRDAPPDVVLWNFAYLSQKCASCGARRTLPILLRSKSPGAFKSLLKMITYVCTMSD